MTAAAPGLGGRLFSRRWRFVTVLVVIGMLFLARLGFWQLDRLEQRRAANSTLAAQLAAAPLLLTGTETDAALLALRDRPVQASGEYDLAAQLVLLSQNYEGQPGVHLITPLRLDGSDRAVLVDRGWLPAEAAAPEAWSAYDVTGRVTITGFLQIAALPAQLSVADYDNRVDAPVTGWFYLFVAAIQQQFSYDLLPIHILAAPTSAAGPPPVRIPFTPDLSEGSHLSYAVQWFLFSLMLGGGYLYYVYRNP